MWFKKKPKIFEDPRTIEFIVGELAVVKQQIIEFEERISTNVRHINQVRGLVNKKLSYPEQDTQVIDKEARKFYESTVEYAELNKGLNNPED